MDANDVEMTDVVRCVQNVRVTLEHNSRTLMRKENSQPPLLGDLISIPSEPGSKQLGYVLPGTKRSIWTFLPVVVTLSYNTKHDQHAWSSDVKA